MFLKIIFSSIFLIIISVFSIYFFDNKGDFIIPKTPIIKDSKSKLIIPDLSSDEAKKFYKGAKTQIGIIKEYDFSNGYYSGGYPPAGKGVCSDLIRQSYKSLDLDFKKIINEAVNKNLKYYNNDTDSNVNFRRVKILWNFFERNNKQKLTNELKPNNIENLKNWQVGDIVIFDQIPPKGLWHIAIISDLRREDGVPYMIDNHGYGVDIRITPLDWPGKIIGHYRVF